MNSMLLRPAGLNFPVSLRATAMYFGLVLLLVLPPHWVRAGDVTWTGGAGGTGTAWLTTANWDTGVPTSIDNAIFGAAGSATTITILMSTSGGVQPVGSITMDAGNFANRTIRNNSTTTAGTLELHGVNGTLLANHSGAQLSLINQLSTSTSLPMRVGLVNSGNIHVDLDGSASQIVISSSIDEVGGSRGFTKTGAGILYLQGTNNTFTGSITNTAGAVKVNATATFGDGTAPFYMAGGNIISGSDRSGGVPLSNPIVMQADGFIFNDAGLAGTSRTLPFSGPFSGTSGTLTIANLTLAVDQTFIVRLLGAFTFDRPMVVGSPFDTSGSFSVLQLYNSATNGVQTFTGDISGQGSVRRQGSTTSPGGTTIFTGNNTYSGGTLITYGTLLANNTGGSALGSGIVTVTNQGVLGGTGAVVASTEVGLGGTVAPGTSVGNLAISDLTLSEGGNYVWQISSATGTAGTAWDLITVSGTWTDLASATNPFTIKVDSMGVPPAGWSSGTARTWTIIQGGFSSGFDPSHFAIDTTAFAGAVQGIFSLSEVAGSLRLTYTPAADIVINVPAGTQTQGQAGHPVLTGSFGVLKIGNGEVVLTNALNDYLGSTKIHAGTASISVDALNGSGAFGAASTAVLLGNTTGSSNATMNINTDGITMGRALVVQSGSTGSKTIGTTISSGVATYTGDVTLQDNAVLTAASGGEAVMAGVISGAGGVTKTGAGTVTLGALNTYTGDTTLSNGTLRLNNRAGTGTFTVAGASTIDNTSGANVTLVNTNYDINADITYIGTNNLSLGSAPVTISGNRTLDIANNTVTLGGPIGGSGGISKNGGGTLVMNGVNTYTGTTVANAGALQINGTATYGDGSGTVHWAGANIILSGTRSTVTGIIPNPVNMTADTVVQNTTTATAGTRNFPFGSDAINAPAGTLTIRNIATGNFTNIMNLRFTGAGFTFARPIVFDNSLAGSQVNNTSQLDCYSSNGTPAQIFTGVISGTGRVRRGAQTTGDGGTTILTGANTYTLDTILDDGDLGLGVNTVSGGGVITSGPIGTAGLEWTGDSGLFAHGGPRVIENFVNLNGVRDGRFEGTNNLTLAGTMNVGTVAKGFTVNNTGVTTFSGQLTNTAPLTKGGPGVLVLTGDNQNSGGWTVTNGTLRVNNTTGSGTGSSNVVVIGPGALSGTGTVGGGLVVANGTVLPGDSAGLLTVGGGMNLSNGGMLQWELAANSTSGPGVNYDLVSLTGGNLVLDGTSQLAINFTGSATVPDAGNPFWQSARQWTIVFLSGSGANPGMTKFASIANGTYPAGSFTNYVDVSGNIILEFIPGGGVPEPVIDSKIVGAGTANATLNWSAQNGVEYQVQYKTNLNQVGWLTLGNVTATGSTASLVDNTGPHPQRFYRVIVP